MQLSLVIRHTQSHQLLNKLVDHWPPPRGRIAGSAAARDIVTFCACAACLGYSHEDSVKCNPGRWFIDSASPCTNVCNTSACKDGSSTACRGATAGGSKTALPPCLSKMAHWESATVQEIWQKHVPRPNLSSSGGFWPLAVHPKDPTAWLGTDGPQGRPRPVAVLRKPMGRRISPAPSGVAPFGGGGCSRSIG